MASLASMATDGNQNSANLEGQPEETQFVTMEVFEQMERNIQNLETMITRLLDRGQGRGPPPADGRAIQGER